MIHKELLQTNQKANIPIYKAGKTCTDASLKKTSKWPLGRCPMASVIRGMQIKTTRSEHFIPTNEAKL